jgi:hypothetical protein
MTDSPTSQAMHLAMTELEYRRERIAVLEDVLLAVTRDKSFCCLKEPTQALARSVLNKETIVNEPRLVSALRSSCCRRAASSIGVVAWQSPLRCPPSDHGSPGLRGSAVTSAARALVHESCWAKENDRA